MENTSGFDVPKTFRGMTAFEEAVIGSVSHKLRFGAPELGWPGDASLQIFLGPYYDHRSNLEVGTSWQVWCFKNAEPYCYMRAKPGTHLDERLIIDIMSHDSRYHNLAFEVKINNEKVARELELAHREKQAVMRDQMYREMTRKQRTIVGQF